jgi:peptide/nickel transport system permease protein
VIRFVSRRLASAFLILWIVSIIAFALGSLAPGDAASLKLHQRSGDPPTAAELEQLRAELGLDQPVPVRYAMWMGSVLRGDAGRSVHTGQPVSSELADRLAASLALALAASVIGIIVSIPLALVAARGHDRIPDHVARIVSLAGISFPSFMLAYLLLLFLAVKLRLLPVSPSTTGGLEHLVLPALTLGLASAASLTRILRASLLDELAEDYVRAARSRGLSEWRLVVRHALGNALNPFVTTASLRFGRLLGEAAIVESIFAWPGVGLYMLNAIYSRDFPAIQATVLYVAAAFLAINIFVDIAYRWLDPRIASLSEARTA